MGGKNSVFSKKKSSGSKKATSYQAPGKATSHQATGKAASSSSSRYAHQGKNGFSSGKKKKKTKSQSPDQILADITAKDFENYKKDFLPVEQALIAEIDGTVAEEKAAKSAASDAGAAFDQGKERFARNVSRTGGSLSAEQQSAADKSAGLSRGAMTAGAANLARRAQSEEDTVTRTNLINAGQELRGQALQGLGQAATMSSQREQAGAAMKAQKQASTMSNIGTGAGLGMMAGAAKGATVGGPWGAVIGAGVGLFASMF